MRRPATILVCCLALAACGDEETKDHGHAHSTTPHGGVVAALKGADGQPAGFLEMKLHDDKGDLELWLARDEAISQPLDLPLDAVVKAKFLDKGGKSVDLAVRNKETNEDEDGKPNVREGKTNYFIFPGSSGQDPSWLVGKEFRSMTVVTIEAEGKTWTSQGFALVPHTHGDGGHAHDH